MRIDLLRAVAVMGLVSAGAALADPQADLVVRGKYLTDAGDCVACHSAPGGKPFAGGLTMKTPFGTLVTPNITPDKDTGIGGVADDQFYRVMHEGIGSKGQYLYPVFPFPWFTRVTRDDALAIRAYLSTVAPVHQAQAVNQMPFPFNVRESLLGWRQIFFKAETFAPDPAKSDVVNRGAYLVEGLGHCAECHTPHDPLGASEQSKSYSGATIDDWYAPNISSDMAQGIGSWSEDQLVTYLKTGVAPNKAIVAGPMAQVVMDSLSKLTDADLHAMAAYLKQVPAKASYPVQKASTAASTQGPPPGEAVYVSHCAMCHRQDGKGVAGVIASLDGNGAVLAGGAQDVTQVVLGGLPARGTYAAMPAVGVGMTDQEIADVANYVRGAWSNHAPANAGPGSVGNARARLSTMWNGGACDAADAAVAGAVTPLLSGLTESDMTQRLGGIVSAAEAAAPKLSRAELVNSLAAAYCPVLKQAGSIAAPLKAQTLGTFVGLAYGQIVAPGVALK